jgi:hypothetical protein
MLEGLRMEGLPVLYYSNSNVWKTSEIFKKWLKSSDMDVQRKARMVLLLLNNSVAHPHLDSLKNIYLEFPSPTSTPLVQPIDMGILKNLKTLYHRMLVNYSLKAIGGNLLTYLQQTGKSAQVLTFYKQYNLLPIFGGK